MLKELDVCWLFFFQILTIETIEVCRRKWDCSVVELHSGGKLQMASVHMLSACFPSLFMREGRKEKDRKAIT